MNLKVLTLLFTLTLITSCESFQEKIDSSTTPNDNTMMQMDLEDETPLMSATVSGKNGYTANSNVDLYYLPSTDTYSLVFSNSLISTGPNLRVYLSDDSNASNFLDLGELKAQSGTFRYDFPATDYNPNYRNVLIWCSAFSVSFGEGIL